MKLTRRDFFAVGCLLGLGACAKLKPKLEPAKNAMARLTPDLSMLKIGDKGPFTFATLSGFHLRDARSTTLPARAAQQLAENEAVSFAVALGDLASGGALQELSLAKQTLAPLEKRAVAIPGENDLHPRREDAYANFRRKLGATKWVHERHGWRMIGLGVMDGVGEGAMLGEEGLSWLAKELQRTPKKQPIALFTHHPLMVAPERYRLQDAGEALALFSKHALKVVASGHYHGNQEAVVDGVLHTVSAACSGTVDNDDGTSAKGYRLFHVDGKDEVTTEFVAI